MVKWMTKYLRLLSTGAFLGGLLVALVSGAGFLGAVPVVAEGGIAISGSFYQQPFEIPQDSSISGPDVYVVVFNQSSDQLNVRMTSQTPPGVELVLSHSEFTLPASGQQMIQVGVEVGADVAPGQYEITIIAEPYRHTPSGIEILGAASQKAHLDVSGESGTVKVQATSPDQQPIWATVRLYRVVSGRQYEVAYSENGTLDVKVAPGTFVAASFLGGVKLAEEQFDVANGETKSITLAGATVYFEGFDIVPNYHKDSGELAFVQIVYTVRNLYQRVEEGEVILQVSYNGSSPTETLLATLSPLETGRVGLNYSYIPDAGWADGSYDFQLQLNLDGKPYASSLVKNLTVSDGGNGGNGAGGMSAHVIGGIAAAAVVVAGIVLLFALMRRSS